MYLLDNQQEKISAASASLRETHYFEHSLLETSNFYTSHFRLRKSPPPKHLLSTTFKKYP
jgi:hypothetical protein